MKHGLNINKPEGHGDMKTVAAISLMMLLYVLWLYIIYAFYTPSVLNGIYNTGGNDVDYPAKSESILSKSFSFVSNAYSKNGEFEDTPVLK